MKSKSSRELILSVETLKEKIRVYSFEVEQPVDGQMSSGFIIKWRQFATKDDVGCGANQECLDDDHVYRTMKDIGVSKKLRKFVLKHL
jgi:hypothetical protein